MNKNLFYEKQQNLIEQTELTNNQWFYIYSVVENANKTKKFVMATPLNFYLGIEKGFEMHNADVNEQIELVEPKPKSGVADVETFGNFIWNIQTSIGVFNDEPLQFEWLKHPNIDI
jgi:hypothetical protein